MEIKNLPDRWAVHKILKGGMGVVYIVYNQRERSVYAAKTYQDELAVQFPTFVDRFIQEARTWINLDIHQNTTSAHFIEIINGKPFLFLEYVSGGDLSGWIRDGRLREDLPQVLRFAIQFCDGISHALSKGIKAHRDIKPQNCLIAHDKTLKITDFGLARIFDDAPSGLIGPQASNILVSQTGMGMGTCPYMAPEQFENAKHVDVRADIYSFGVMLYEMMTGKLPFLGRNFFEFQQLHTSQQAPELKSKLPKLDEIVQRCLAKDPAHRYDKFEVLRTQLADIFRLLTGKDAPQPVVGPALTALQWCTKGASLNELGHLEETLECYDRAIEIDPRVEIGWTNRANVLSKMGRHEEALTSCERAIEIDARDELAWLNKGVALHDLGRPADAIDCYEVALQIDQRLEEAWYSKANALYHLERFEEALICYERTLEIKTNHSGAWVYKGACLYYLSRWPEALYCFDHALDLEPRLLDALLGKGKTQVELGLLEEALDSCERALEFNSHVDTPWILKGEVLRRLGRRDEALDCFDRALNINPHNAYGLAHKGNLLLEMRQVEEGLKHCDRALDEDPNSLMAWISKGLALTELQRYEDAIICFNRVLDLNVQVEQAWLYKGFALGHVARSGEAMMCFERVLELNPAHSRAWFNKGALLGNSGNFQEALDCFKQADVWDCPMCHSGLPCVVKNWPAQPHKTVRLCSLANLFFRC